jgi:hypothetical protein
MCYVCTAWSFGRAHCFELIKPQNKLCHCMCLSFLFSGFAPAPVTKNCRAVACRFSERGEGSWRSIQQSWGTLPTWALWPRFSGNTRAGNLGCHRKMVNHDGFLLPLTRAFHPNSEGISILQYVSQGFKAQPYECILGVLRMNYYYWCGQCWVQNKVKNIRWGHLSKSLGTWRFWCKPCLNNIIRWFTKFKAKWPSPMAWAESQFKFWHWGFTYWATAP